MKYFLFLVLFAVGVSSNKFADRHGNSQSPNVLVLTVEDAMISSVNNKLSSSDIYNLAIEGIVLDSIQSCIASVPSRESFFTGMILPCHLTYNQVIEPTYVSLPKKFEQLGYDTKGIGNWHNSFDQTNCVFQSYFNIWGEYSSQSTTRGVWMNDGVFSFSDVFEGSDLVEPTETVTNRHVFDLYTDVAISHLKERVGSSIPFFMFLAYDTQNTVSMFDDTGMSRENGEGNHPCDSFGDVEQQNKCRKMIQLDKSVSSLVDYLKSSTQWKDTILVILSETTHGTEDRISGDEVKISALFSGGFVERSMAVAGVLPYRFESAVHISDLHATLFGLASASSFNLTDTLGSDYPATDGVDLWGSMIPDIRRRRVTDDHNTKVNRRLEMSEYEILSKLYFDTNGPNWLTTTNWMTGVPCPSGLWYGVTCSTNNVNGLTLDSLSLLGQLPSQIGLLSMMSSFQFQSNQLSGSLPSELGLLSLIESLQFQSTKLFGQFPSQFGVSCPLIGALQFHSNQLSSSLPSQIGLLSLITTFRFHSNQLSGSLPSELGSLTGITSRFLMSENSFIGAIPSEIGLWTLFDQQLKLDSNQFSSTLPSQLGQLTLISKYFIFNDNKLTGKIPSEFGELTGLTKWFSMNSNQLSGVLPSQLGTLYAMKGEMGLHQNSFSGLIPSQLGTLIALTAPFEIYSNLLCGNIPQEVELMTSLVSGVWDMATGNSFGTPCCETLPLVYTFCAPTSIPTPIPTNVPTSLPTLTLLPTSIPSPQPSPPPTGVPLPPPTSLPSVVPSLQPSLTPSPTNVPKPLPTSYPTVVPSPQPTSTSSPTTLPTLSPTPIPSDLPTIKPTSSPTLSPTLVPTLVPTSLPSPQPTITAAPTNPPSPLPTFLPTTPPTSVPTLIPTSAPTYFPTLSPTSVPTYVPTSLPSAIPTNAPTVYCLSGTYYDGIRCIGCPIGKYTNFSVAPYPSACSFCPSGQYSIVTGADKCVECARGKLSSADFTFCEDCEAGQYSNSIVCVNCERGRYAPQPLSDECLVCSNGSHTDNETGSISCTTCGAGKYSRDASVSCSVCPVGKYSSNGATECEVCAAGFVSSHEGATTCSACSAGYYAATSSLASCTSCSPGKYQDSTGQQSCTECEKGRYSALYGRTVCSYCTIGRSSAAGSDSCSIAAESYYMTSMSFEFVTHCPRYSSCLGGMHAPIPEVDYWVDHSDYKYAGDIYRCTRSTCKGGTNHSICSTINGYNKSYCGDEQCREGSEGPLCGSCSKGFVYHPVTYSCEACSANWVIISLVLGSAFIVAICIVILLTVGHYQRPKQLLSKVFKYVDSGTLKVLWVTYQIISSSSFALNIQFPKPFSHMLVLLSVFSLDFLALDCLDLNQNAYFVKIYLWCLVPLFVGIVITATGVIRVYMRHTFEELKRARRNWTKHSKTFNSFQGIVNQHTWLLLLLSYLVLPAVSNQQWRSFNCIQLESGEQYLGVDTSIDCQGDEYIVFRSVVIFFVLIYQLIPITWMVILFRNKKALIPPTLKYDEELAMFTRDNNPDLAAFRFLFIDYTCDKWWFEIVDMYRRIAFIGIVPLVSQDSSTRASFGMLLSIISLVYIGRYEPYRAHFTNIIAFVAQVSILVTFYGALTIESKSLVSVGLSGTSLGIFLVVVNLSVVVLAFWFAYESYRRSKAERNRIKIMATKCDWAVGFDEKKFRKIFDSISRYIPSTDVMVFYYCSSFEADRARKSGLPALKRFNGIPFTLRRPHSTTKDDFDVFNASEKYNIQAFPQQEVLVLSIPGVFLQPLKGYEDKSGLCMVSADVLKAMRPSMFKKVVDSKPWINKLVLMPPHCIIRSLLIMEKETKGIIAQVSTSDIGAFRSFSIVEDKSTKNNMVIKLTPITSSATYLEEMSEIRRGADKLNLVPMYHYTSISAAKLILKTGFRIPNHGQRDGGIHFTTQGPCSFHVLTPQYEINVIKNFCGVERIHEFKGKGIFDAIIVYACHAPALEQVPSEEPQSKMISRCTLQKFSLSDHENDNYFLRPDRILGAFVVNFDDELPQLCAESRAQGETEIMNDRKISRKLVRQEALRNKNCSRMETYFQKMDDLQVSDDGVAIPSPPVSPDTSMQTEESTDSSGT